MKILITGASSGFGALTARALHVNAVADRVRAEFLTRIGLSDLLHPTR